MTKPGKVVLILGGLAVAVVFFVIPTLCAMKSIFVWYAYWRYVDEVSNVSGINRYLVTAAGLLLFIPFWFGATMAFSVGSRQRRLVGTGILIGLAVLYNLSLFWVTRETSFAFSGGAPQKWYALTPAGVRVYDRPGVDPTYGIPLKPVTPEVVRTLELLKQGEFKPADPTRLTFFNPITGAAQAWYDRSPEGTLEFYDKPGFGPSTGEPLKPVTKEIVLEWRRKRDAEAAQEEARRRTVAAAQKPVEEQGRRRAPSGCAVGHPCSLELVGDGSTKVVSIPVGYSVCFEGWFWNHIPKLGYMTSYQGGPEKKFECTLEDVTGGKCRKRMADSFRLVPEKGVPVPRYWFINEGESECGAAGRGDAR